MVSPLWFAADSGDVEQVHILLKDASQIDIEIKDEAGATPLVQAVKNGHEDIVKALLDAGADPTVSSSHGSIEQLTTDTTILGLLSAARDKMPQAESEPVAGSPAPGPGSEQTYIPPPAPEGYSQNYTGYGQVPPLGSYMYYPAPFPGAMLPDGSPATYYPPPPPPNGAAQTSENMGNGTLPPPEIARLIPCRYYPACRYGPSCIFAHPQGPFFQGPLPPPAHYSAHYDPMSQAPYGAYYAVPQTPYPQQPPSANPAASPQNSSQSPLSQPQHVHSGSDVTSPVQGPYNPTNAPPPVPYGIPVPSGYPPPGHMHVATMHPGMHPGQQSSPQPNGFIYSPTSPVVQSPTHRRDPSLFNGTAQYPQMEGAGINGAHPMQIPSQQDAYANVPRSQLREGPNQLRRGSVRRMSAGGSTNRKPPCAFFPSGRCRNGDACKFPHILPEPGESPQGTYVSKFGGRARAQTQPQGDQLSEKMAGLNLRSDGQPTNSHVNGQGHPNGFARSNSKLNGTRHEKRNGTNGRSAHQHQSQQRVPSADDFPVLGGSVTPPSRSPVASTLNGPTAAELLKAPPPAVAKSEKASSDGTNTPSAPSENGSSVKDSDGVSNGHTNGVNGFNASGENASAQEIMPLSFAAVATVGSTSPPESASAVTVSVSA